MSFDVTNLFTQVPIADALQVIEQRLSQDHSLLDRTAIPMFGWRLFRCSWSLCSSTCPSGLITKVSSTYRCHSLGWSGADLIASSSRFSVSKLATMDERGEPLAAPSIWGVTSLANSLAKLQQEDHIADAMDHIGTLSLWILARPYNCGKLV